MSEGTGNIFQAFNPSTGEVLPGRFYTASTEDIDAAMEKAVYAANMYRETLPRQKAAFLKTIGEEIMALGSELIRIAMQETGLPEYRIIAERGRTVNQINMFAQLLEEGSWTEAVIETAQPGRGPVPKPDIRKMLKGVGPVVVFSASNFPLAFSTAGGDTISALAAGNPVVVKAHPSHPATNLLVGEAIYRATKKNDMPDGIFSTLYSNNFEVGLNLVKHPATKSVAFTGSFSGGMALYRAAMQREDPIPVFAEMGSINPVILLPEALQKNGDNLAKILSASITLGGGQFCTNPGLIVATDGDPLMQFMDKLVSEVAQIKPQTMLNTQIWKNYNKKKLDALKEKGVELFAGNRTEIGAGRALPALARVSFDDFKKNENLNDEIFGPFSLLVVCKNVDELEKFAGIIRGQLTISIFGGPEELPGYKKLFTLLASKCGRLIFNGPPTGVEVCHAMNHGGPFPATTDSRFTSVGPAAIKRFARPVAYQDCPESLLPEELQGKNPLNIWRWVNGDLTKGSVN